MAVRAPIREFSLANPLYRGATVTFFTVSGAAAKTTTKATLYDGPSGTTTVVNPQILDSQGKLAQPTYIESPVIGTVSDITAPDHDTGIINAPGVWRGNWATATVYYAGEFIVAPAANDFDIVQVVTTHTSGTFATDLSGGKLTLAIDISVISQGAAAAAALRLNFDSSTTMADPGTGDIRLNNATLSSVTAIALSALSALIGNPDFSDYIVTWDDGAATGNRGTLIIRKSTAPQNFAIFTLTGTVTDNATWLQVAVTHVASSGSFSAADELTVQFIRTGDIGGLSSTTPAKPSSAGTGGVATDVSRSDHAHPFLVKGTDIVAASDITIPAGFNYFDITGATQINSMTVAAGTWFILQFDSTPVVAHGAAINLPGLANITMQAGDEFEFYAVAANTVRGINRQRAANKPLYPDVTETLTKGFNASEFDAGTKSSGTYTPDPANGNFQKAVNGGAHTLAAPATTCSIVLQYTNNATAGTITISGYADQSGENLTTTNGDDFLLFITRVNGFSTVHIRALQ